MTRKIGLCLCVTALVGPMILSGCGKRQTYDKQQFVLSAVRAGEPVKQGTDHILEVRRFTVDSAFKGKGLVYRIGDFEYETDFYSEFLISPSDMVTEKTRNWLSQSKLFQRVLDIGSQVDPTHLVEGNVAALYGDFRDTSSPKATMEIRLFLLHTESGKEPVLVFGQTYQSSVGVESEGPEGLMEALDRCLSSILSDWEKDLAGRSL